MPAPQPETPKVLKKEAACSTCRAVTELGLLVATGRGRYECMACAMARSASHEAQRWQEADQLGLTPAEKCAAEAAIWQARK